MSRDLRLSTTMGARSLAGTELMGGAVSEAWDARRYAPGWYPTEPHTISRLNPTHRTASSAALSKRNPGNREKSRSLVEHSSVFDGQPCELHVCYEGAAHLNNARASLCNLDSASYAYSGRLASITITGGPIPRDFPTGRRRSRS